MKSYEIIQHKIKFVHALQPFLEMLADQKSNVSHDDWLKMVNNLATRADQDPEQYLEPDLPSAEVTGELVKEIFQEFISVHTPKVEETYRWV